MTTTIDPKTLPPATRKALNALARRHHAGRCTHVIIDDAATEPMVCAQPYGVMARRGKCFFPGKTHTFPSGGEYYVAATTTITLSAAALEGMGGYAEEEQ